MHSAASPAKATPQPNLWRDCWGLGKDLWKGRIQNWRTLPGWWCFFGKRFGNNIGARIATSSPSRGWNIRKLFETPRPQKKGLGYPQMEVWNMNFFTASIFSCWGVRKIEKTQANCFRGISISHLGKRKIRDSKMPTGRGYISFQEGTSWSFLDVICSYITCHCKWWQRQQFNNLKCLQTYLCAVRSSFSNGHNSRW